MADSTTVNLLGITNFDKLKIAKTGVISLAQIAISSPGAGNFGSDTGTLGSATHNLGYIPAVLAYIDFANGTRTLLPFQTQDTLSASTARWNFYYATVTTSSIFIQFRRIVYGTSSTTFALPVTVRYYLLQESAS